MVYTDLKRMEALKVISYEPLLILLVKAKKNTTDLKKDLSISPSTLSKLNKGGYISLEVINKIGNYISNATDINVTILDLVEFIPDDPQRKE